MQKSIENFIKSIIVKEIKKNLKVYLKKALIYCSCFYFSYKSLQFIRRSYIQHQWDEVCRRKKTMVEQRISEFKKKHIDDLNIPLTLQHEIINSTIAELKQMLYEQKVTVQQILIAFINQTIAFALKFHLIMEVLFEEALVEAVKQDNLIKQDKNIIFKEGNELFGIPVSLKDTLKLMGTDTTFGLASKYHLLTYFDRCLNPDEEDGFQAYSIKQAGGIIFVKTTVPQGGSQMQSQNFIFGRSMNPWDLSRSTGGSSGGEAGLLTIRGAAVGIGTDLSGSIRTPAAYNGICAYKPSSLRNCNSGEGNIMEEMRKRINIQSVQGPMGNNVDDLVQISKVLLNVGKYDDCPMRIKDPYYYPYEFDDKLYKSNEPLRIGFVKSFNLVPACKANQRAVEMTIEALKNKGHEIITFDMDEKIYNKLAELFYKFWLADSNLSNIQKVTKGERLIDAHKENIRLANVPKFILKIQSWFYRVLKYKRQSLVYKIFSSTYSASDLQKFNGQLQDLAHQVAEKWDALSLDALIMPASSGVAFKHGQSSNLAMSQMYTVVWNILDYSAGVVPVTNVQENEQFYKINQEKYGRRDKFAKTMVELMNGSAGLPVAVQVVTLPHEDETCLRVMNEIEKEVQFNFPEGLK